MLVAYSEHAWRTASGRRRGSAGSWAMLALTRRRYPERQDCWHAYSPRMACGRDRAGPGAKSAGVKHRAASLLRSLNKYRACRSDYLGPSR